MRFAFVSTLGGARWGGSEELWSRTALNLARSGHKVSASVTWWPSPSPRILELQKIGAELYFRKRGGESVGRRIWRFATGRNISHQNLNWLQSRRPDLVIISQGGNSDGLEWMELCETLQVPFVAILQCNTEKLWPKDDRLDRMTRAYVAARKVFCVSRHNLQLLEHQLGICLPNATVTWNPVNVSTDHLPTWPSEDVGYKLACVARLEPAAKGQDLLFAVMSKPKWRERSLKLNLIGTGPCEKSLRQLSEYLDLRNVSFNGYSSNIDEIWESHHMLILPSRYEGMPLALVEAMWCGRPALVTDIGGNTEVCEDAKTGFVAPGPSVELVDATLERAWAMRTEWKSIGMAARAKAEKSIPRDPVPNFSQELIDCAQTTMAKSADYRDALSRSRVPSA